MKCVTFGEIMMRLNPEGFYRLVQANKLEVSYSGAEANVAVSLATLGVDATYVTKLPANDLGRSAVNELRRHGVDVGRIVTGGKRIGVYYVERGASQRPSKVIYDRAGSAIATAVPGDFDWNDILKEADWFHFTGITPALGEELPGICLAACKAAKEHGVMVSCDLNYRKNLWSRERAGEVMATLMPYVDLCIANEEDAADVFGIRAPDTDVEAGRLAREGYGKVACQLVERFGFKKVAITLRGSISASENEWGGMIYDARDAKACFSPTYHIWIVDRVGGGDSFAAGLIYGLMNSYSDQEAVNFAAAASCIKHSIEHDFNLTTLEEIARLAAGDASGRVQR
jgi:2-dehydro-3-deoxygluconokinase